MGDFSCLTVCFQGSTTVEQGPKRRPRAESFADHYSQARQFFISQTMGEQAHIAAALTFELSKVKTPATRERMVSHLLNVDETLANKVAAKLQDAFCSPMLRLSAGLVGVAFRLRLPIYPA